MSRKVEPIIGKRFKYLTVIKEIEMKNNRTMVRCLCDCGKCIDMPYCRLNKLYSSGTCGCTKGRKPNYYITCNTYTELIIGKYKVLIDSDMADKLKSHTWFISDNRPKTYDGLPMGNVILGLPKNIIVDHKDKNTLNNFKSNLRKATKRQNLINRMSKNKYGYRGVSITHGYWRAMIGSEGKRYYLGRFKTKELAAMAYDEAAKELHGEFAILNFK